jgi:hypothetical protein
MDHNQICTWLGLPAETWPPDHYRLLGLEAGENDAELIEQLVHERLDLVRRYQLTHPEQATEAMNRLAQAFVCLTEPSAKKTYDVELGIAASTLEAATTVASEARVDVIDWLSSPPPVLWPNEKPSALPANESPPLAIPLGPPPLPRLPPPLPPLPPVPTARYETALLTVPVAAVAPQLDPLLDPVDTVLEAAQSGPARRNIATKRTLYHRIAQTRRLQRLWNDLGKYVSSPKRRLSRSQDGPELIRLLEEVTALLRDFPPLLGEAGQPGYLLLALTQVDTIKVFQSFSPQQRDAMSRDWHNGVKLLSAHRDFLRQELRDMRKRSMGQRMWRAGWSLVVDRPGTLLLLIALLALNIALWRSYVEELWERFFSR